MGFFKKSVTTVGVSNSNLIPPDQELVYSYDKQIIGAILRSEDIAEAILISAVSNFGNKIKGYLSYGKTHYYRNLPTSVSNSVILATAEVTQILADIEGEPITLLSADYGGLDHLVYGCVYLQDIYDWKSDINQVLISNKVYNVQNIQYIPEIYPDYDQYHRYIPPRIKFTYQNPDNEFDVRHEYIDFEVEGTYYAGRYEVDSAPLTGVYYYLPVSESTNPELIPDTSQDGAGEFYPIAILRENFYSIHNTKTTKQYITTKKLLRRLDLDLDDLILSIEENPNISKVRGTFFVLSIDTTTERDTSKKYLFNYFKRISALSSTTKENFESQLGLLPEGGGYVTGAVEPDNNIIEIKESNYNKLIKYNYIHIETISGVIGEEGKIKTEFITRPDITFSYDNHDVQDSEAFTVSNGEFIMQFQISANSYTQVTVHGLVTSVLIGGKFATAEVGAEGILIPINTHDLEKLNAFEQELVLQDSMHLVMYAQETTNLKWYQTSAFKFAMAAVMIVTFAFSGGTSLSIFTTAFTTIAGFIDLILVITITYAIAWIGKRIGGALGVAFVIAAMIAFSAYTNGFGNTINSFASPDIYLKLVSASMDVLQNDLMLEMDELGTEQSIFEDELKDRKEELQLAKDLLGDGTFDINPLLFTSSTVYINPNESPDGFYSRTLNTDPGGMTIEAVEVFNELALQLPEVGDSIPGLNTDGAVIEGNVDWFKIS